MKLWICSGVAFLAGAIPTAYWAARWLKGIDIRSHGSGNVGATNALRVLGKGPGLVVFAIDVLKGALPILYFVTVSPLGPLATGEKIVVALAGVAGHVLNPFLGFRGGKGVAVATGALSVLYPACLMSALAVWGAIFWSTRIVSAASLGASVALFASGWLFAPDPLSLSFLGLLCLIAFVGHRKNIARILRGEEKKL